MKFQFFKRLPASLPAEKKAELEKSEEIGQIASGIGHEIRNSLAAIQNVVYFMKGTLAKASPKDDSVMEMILIAEKEIASSVKICDDLVEFSKSMKVFPAKAELAVVLQTVLARAALPPGVRLQKKIDSVPPAFIDTERMRQVFSKLISNALEAMPQGGTLEVEIRRDPAGYVEAFVRDTGQGIPEENHGKVFDPFFTTKENRAGLGLAIARTIVKFHDGELSFKSVPGSGTEFKVRVPIFKGG